MILYHGTGIRFAEIDLSQSKDKRDFGKGFYTTTIYEQAEKWTQNQHVRYGTKSKFVKKYEYVFDDTLKIKNFKSYSKVFELFALDSRQGGLKFATVFL